MFSSHLISSLLAWVFHHSLAGLPHLADKRHGTEAGRHLRYEKIDCTAERLIVQVPASSISIGISAAQHPEREWKMEQVLPLMISCTLFLPYLIFVLLLAMARGLPLREGSCWWRHRERLLPSTYSIRSPPPLIYTNLREY